MHVFARHPLALLIAPLLAMVMAIVLAACADVPPPPAAPRPVVVESPRGLGALGDSYPGSVHARVEVDLSFRVPGKIAQRKVELGSRVTSGAVLAMLDPLDARLNLDAAKASTAAAEADLWLAQEEQKRFTDLKARGFIGQSALDARTSTTKLA